jgi:predicted N-acetyltransferase YhbS
LGSVPVMTSCNSRGSETMFSLGSVPVMTSYNNRGIGGSVCFVVCLRAI